VRVRTVPSMRRKGSPTVVCQVWGCFSTRLLIVSRIFVLEPTYASAYDIRDRDKREHACGVPRSMLSIAGMGCVRTRKMICCRVVFVVVLELLGGDGLAEVEAEGAEDVLLGGREGCRLGQVGTGERGRHGVFVRVCLCERGVSTGRRRLAVDTGGREVSVSFQPWCGRLQDIDWVCEAWVRG
jgi:hypothetical protein